MKSSFMCFYYLGEKTGFIDFDYNTHRFLQNKSYFNPCFWLSGCPLKYFVSFDKAHILQGTYKAWVSLFIYQRKKEFLLFWISNRHALFHNTFFGLVSQWLLALFSRKLTFADLKEIFLFGSLSCCWTYHYNFPVNDCKTSTLKYLHFINTSGIWHNQ